MCAINNFPWSETAQILVATASLVISLFAYRLAKKISFKKTVKDRQFEVVSQFIRAFSSSMISISWQNYGGGGGSLFYLSYMRTEQFRNENANLFFDSKIIVQEDGFNNFNFISLIGDPFIPEELYVELNKFWYRSHEKIEDPQAAYKYLIICNHKEYSNPNYYVPLGNEFKNFKAFFDFINKIMDITNEWLDKHEASELKFRK